MSLQIRLDMSRKMFAGFSGLFGVGVWEGRHVGCGSYVGRRLHVWSFRPLLTLIPRKVLTCERKFDFISVSL
jgi:hypothetical protein